MPSDKPQAQRAAGPDQGSWRIASVAGIPIRVHWLMLVALPFFAYLMATDHFAGGDPVTPVAFAWGGLLAIVLFASVTVHELAHSLMAMRFGIRVRSITLLPIGGVSQMEQMPKEPRREFLVSFVGPLTNFVIAAPLLVLVYGDFLPAMSASLEMFLRWMAFTNLSLGVFNLFLPAFPMDGGRILRSLLARRMDFVRATNIAAAIGRALAFAMGILGFFALPGGIWLLLIAFFIYAGAGAEARMVGVEHVLGRVTVGDIMTRHPILVSPDENLAQLLRRMMETKHIGFPVADASGRPIGFVGLEELGRVDEVRLASTRVREAMRENPPLVSPSLSAAECLRVMADSKGTQVLVTEKGRLVGITTKTDLERIVTILSAARKDPAKAGGDLDLDSAP